MLLDNFFIAAPGRTWIFQLLPTQYLYSFSEHEPSFDPNPYHYDIGSGIVQDSYNPVTLVMNTRISSEDD